MEGGFHNQNSMWLKFASSFQSSPDSQQSHAPSTLGPDPHPHPSGPSTPEHGCSAHPARVGGKSPPADKRGTLGTVGAPGPARHTVLPPKGARTWVFVALTIVLQSTMVRMTITATTTGSVTVRRTHSVPVRSLRRSQDTGGEGSLDPGATQYLNSKILKSLFYVKNWLFVNYNNPLKLCPLKLAYVLYLAFPKSEILYYYYYYY